jgi:hypothetical protein
LADYAGDLGDRFVNLLASRVDSGDFGQILKDLSASVYTGNGNRRGGNTGFGNPYEGGAGNPYGDEGNPGDDVGLAPPGGGAGAGLGLGAPGGPQPPPKGRPGGAGGVGGGRPSGNRPPSDDVGQQHLLAGVTFLGIGNQREMLEKAQDQGIDVLVMFDVKVSVNPRNRVITNEVRMDARDTITGEILVRGKSLNNVKVQTSRADDNKEDPVEDWVENVANMLDSETKGLKMADLPAGLTTDPVLRRIDTLIASNPRNPLPVLAEIAFYHSLGLVDDQTRQQKFQQVIGELPGEQLAIGTPQERQEILKKWLPNK